MDDETGAASKDSVLVAAGAPVFLRQLCECNRRRVLLDPASEFLDPRVIGHSSIYHAGIGCSYGTTVTVWGADVLASPVTVSVTVNVAEYAPAAT